MARILVGIIVQLRNLLNEAVWFDKIGWIGRKEVIQIRIEEPGKVLVSFGVFIGSDPVCNYFIEELRLSATVICVKRWSSPIFQSWNTPCEQRGEENIVQQDWYNRTVLAEWIILQTP